MIYRLRSIGDDHGGSVEVRRSTFVLLGVGTFASILGIFIVRGSTRLLIGDRASLLLVTPLAVLSLLLVVVLVVVALGDLTGFAKMEDDLGD